MKTIFAAIFLICFLSGNILTGCGRGTDNVPVKGTVFISDELKETDGTGQDSVNKIKTVTIPEETDTEDNTRKNKYKKIHSDEDIDFYPSGTIVVGNSAYEQYNYSEECAVKYADAVNRIALKLQGISDVYNMVIPTSIGITLPDNKRDAAGSSDQEQSLEKIAAKMSGNVKIVPLYNKMMEHRKEYIYFRTDHHWTAKGAYYGFDSFCQVKEIMPRKLKNYKKVSFGSFAGSFYKDTGQASSLEKDILYAYYPLNNNKIKLEYTNKDGVTVKGNVIEDASGYGEGVKYSAFIDADNPYTIIKNKALDDGSSCLVIKESFGNALVPFLTDYYQTVYVIDYRYWEGSLTSFLKENPAGDVIIANNISMTRNSYQTGKLAALAEG